MIGERFGSLSIMSEFNRPDRKAPRWMAKCDCGVEKEVCSRSVRRGRTSSCGCAQRKSATKHALSGHELYPRWKAMLARCYDERAISYPNYGARGIRVCAEWAACPDEFIAWGERHGLRKGYDIDRINNDGHYEPDNCRVVSRLVNARNTRTSRNVVIAGVEMSIAEAAERAGQPYDRVYQRIAKLGWSPERAVQS